MKCGSRHKKARRRKLFHLRVERWGTFKIKYFKRKQSSMLVSIAKNWTENHRKDQNLYSQTTSRLVPSPRATPTRFLFGRQKEDALYGFSIAGIQILVFSITFSSVFRFRNQHWALLRLEIFNFESSSPLNPQMKWFSAPHFLVTDATTRKLSALLI